MRMHDAFGWAATLLTASSYFFRSPTTLRLVQAGAAVLWLAYGVAVHSLPVIVANVIVAVAATASAFRSR